MFLKILFENIISGLLMVVFPPRSDWDDIAIDSHCTITMLASDVLLEQIYSPYKSIFNAVIYTKKIIVNSAGRTLIFLFTL